MRSKERGREGQVGVDDEARLGWGTRRWSRCGHGAALSWTHLEPQDLELEDSVDDTGDGQLQHPD